MGRIKNTEQYPIKPNPSLSDYVIGTDSEQEGKTVNFPVGSLGSVEGGIQNNRFTLIKIGTATTAEDVATLINAYPVPVTVLADQIPLFVAIKPPATTSEYPKIQYWGLVGIGKGVYGVGGDTTVSNSNPFIIESRISDAFSVLDLLNAVVIDFGEVDDSNIETFVDLINNSESSYSIEAGTNWYFQGNVGGSNILYGWKGDNGEYGSGGSDTEETDLFLIEDETGLNVIPSDIPSGFEKVEEAGQTGLRIVGRNPIYHGNIGEGAIDGTLNDTIGGFGATGDLSVAFGQRTVASGYASFAHGYLVSARNSFTTVFGYNNDSNGYASFIQGYNNIEDSETGFSFTSGINNSNGVNAGFMSGVDLQQEEGVGIAVLGVSNLPVTATNDGSTLTNPVFIVGCGTHTTPSGEPWVSTKRANLIVGLKNGTITFPETTIAIIDAESTGRIPITREWFEAQGLGGSGLNGQLVISENGDGYSLAGRLESNFGDVGEGAIDLSISTGASSVRGATGVNSFAVGRNIRASAIYSIAMGDSAWASAEGAVAIGRFAVASGIGSFAVNTGSLASGLDSFACNAADDASGRASFAAGMNTLARSFAEASFGHNPTDYTPNSADTLDALDRVFTIGIGLGNTSRADGFTVLGNGRIGIGINNFETNTDLERVVINGSVRMTQLVLTGLPTYADEAAAGVGGLATDTVYKTATGELRIKL